MPDHHPNTKTSYFPPLLGGVAIALGLTRVAVGVTKFRLQKLHGPHYPAVGRLGIAGSLLMLLSINIGRSACNAQRTQDELAIAALKEQPTDSIEHHSQSAYAAIRAETARGALAIAAALGNIYASTLPYPIQRIFPLVIGPSAMIAYIESFRRFNEERTLELKKKGIDNAHFFIGSLSRIGLIAITGASFAIAGLCAAGMKKAPSLLLSSFIGIQLLEVSTLTAQAMLTLRAKSTKHSTLHENLQENTIEAGTLSSRCLRGLLASYSLMTALWCKIRSSPLPSLVGTAGKGIVTLNGAEFGIKLLQEAREAYITHQALLELSGTSSSPSPSSGPHAAKLNAVQASGRSR